jgi:hypothetical protein
MTIQHPYDALRRNQVAADLRADMQRLDHNAHLAVLHSDATKVEFTIRDWASQKRFRITVTEL